MPSDKQLRLKNALKECNERAGAHIQKNVKRAEVAARKAKIVKDKADDLKEKNEARARKVKEARARKVKEAKDKREQAVAMKEKKTEKSYAKKAAIKMKKKKAEEKAAAEVEKASKIVGKEIAALKKDEAMQKVENIQKVEAAKLRVEELARKKAVIEEQKKAAREAARAAEEAREVPPPAGAAADLNATYDMEEGQAQAPVPDANSYDMTPARHELPPAPLADQNNYGLEDLQSDEDTDDEENPRKEIPKWAAEEGSDLRAALLKQTYMCPDLDKLFDVIVNPNLADMFKRKRKRFVKRTSSAVWDSTPGSFMLKRT